MSSKTFILGAGFSALARFPLVRNLRAEALSWIKTEKHPSWEPHLKPGVHGYPEGQFCAGLKVADPRGTLGFEELLIALRGGSSAGNRWDPSGVTFRVLRDACGRLLWHRHSSLVLPEAYRNFASWLREHHDNGKPNAIVSLNWDLVAEIALKSCGIPWRYNSATPLVPVLKPHGSINWSRHVQQGLVPVSSDWQPIAPGSPYCYIADDPFSDPFGAGTNQHLRHLIFPGNSEDENGVTRIWAEVADAIREREVVVFIGYSLPAYDSEASRWFRRSAAGKPIEVYVRSRNTLEHYRQTLGELVTNDTVSFESCPYGKAFDLR